MREWSDQCFCSGVLWVVRSAIDKLFPLAMQTLLAGTVVSPCDRTWLVFAAHPVWRYLAWRG